MRYRLTGADKVVIVFGRGTTEFEFAFDVGALRNLVRLGVEALGELGAHVDESSDEVGDGRGRAGVTV